jgi:hypothetical protein
MREARAKTQISSFLSKISKTKKVEAEVKLHNISPAQQTAHINPPLMQPIPSTTRPLSSPHSAD